MKIIYTIIITLTLSSCSLIPKPYGIDRGMIGGSPEGSPNYRLGWEDGCNSGISMAGGLHEKIAYGYTYDANHVLDEDYNDAWEIAALHCRWYTNKIYLWNIWGQ